jgi:hypothetical protein
MLESLPPSHFSSRPSPKLVRVDFCADASHDRRMLKLLIVIGRALALALRGHRELVLENLALRQQLAALKRTTKRPRLQRGDRLSWVALARPLAELAHRTGPCAAGRRRAVASRLAAPPMVATFESSPEQPSTDRSTDPRPCPRDGDGEPALGAPPGFMASDPYSVSTCQNGRCRVS